METSAKDMVLRVNDIEGTVLDPRTYWLVANLVKTGNLLRKPYLQFRFSIVILETLDAFALGHMKFLRLLEHEECRKLRLFKLVDYGLA